MVFHLATMLLILASCGCASLGPLNPMAGFERSMLFHPTAVDTVRSGADFESVQIRVSDDQQIHGLLLEHDTPRGVLLFCHGNAGNVTDRLRRLRELRATHRLTVFGFDYRGYGASDGTPSEKTIYEDARACLLYTSDAADE